MSELFLRDVRLGLDGPLVNVRIADGRVTEIGDDGPGRAEVVDGDGGTLLPGLVDSHVHTEQWASSRRRIPLEQAKSAAEVVDILVRHGHRPRELLLGGGFRDGLWPDTPHKDLLERALPGQAIALFSADLHTLWLSPAALALIGREHPTGVLIENDCMSATAELPAAPPEVVDRWVLEAAEAAAALGVTKIADYEYTDTIAAWERRREAGPLPVRVSCVIARHLLDTTIALGRRTGDTDGLLNVGPYKLFVDGSLNTRTAYCHHAYDSGDHGLLELPYDELVALMRRAAEHGIVPAVHAIGDHANTLALDAFEEIGIGGRIEHAQLVRAEDLPRFAKLGVVASVQPAHQPDDRDVADHHWPSRTADAFPYRALHSAGATLEFGSDSPVAPLDPWDAIASAVERTDDERPAWHPEQALPLEAALKASSGGRGTVKVGDVADLVVVAADMRTADLRSVSVITTILDGRRTFFHSLG
ncbi:amidohydrolase [Amycolatopsis magusensis]|uniref:amidohydrolase n=1 Tax=Amycolatopsis magusensis TaxID=882444 RepID=UPI00379FC4CA